VPTIAGSTFERSASAVWAGLESTPRRIRSIADLRPCGLLRCTTWAVKETWAIVEQTGSYVGGLFAGRESTDQISGFIGVAQVAGEVAKISLLALFSLTAVFSVSVGLINLLPVPMLDGRPPAVLRD